MVSNGFDRRIISPDTGKDSAQEIREYFIPDFSNWKNHDSYKRSFDRLIKDLKAPLDDKESGKDLGTAARPRDVATLAIDEFHLKIVAPNSPDSVLQVFVSGDPHPRINVGDRVENMLVDKSNPSQVGLVVTCVDHSVDTHFGKTRMTTRLETEARPLQ
jgi:hypothetical protein